MSSQFAQRLHETMIRGRCRLAERCTARRTRGVARVRGRDRRWRPRGPEPTPATLLGICIASIVLQLPPSSCGAQQPRPVAKPSWADSTPARIMSLTSTGFPTEPIVHVLRQRHHAYTLAKRRELGDSLVARAIEPSTMSLDAVFALAVSGSADRAMTGLPNSDALEHLITVARTARSAETRSAALLQLVDQTDPARSFSFLREVATSTDATAAFVAADNLRKVAFGSWRGSSTDRSKAASILHDLFEQDLVKTGLAHTVLCEAAVKQRWPSAPKCRTAM